MKAPGKSHRDGISLFELAEMFPDEDSAKHWFETRRWPNGAQCVHCDSKTVQAVSSGKPMPWRCLDCRKYFSVRQGTMMGDSKLPLRKWVFAIYLTATSLKGVSSMKLHRDLNITQKTAWFLAHRIREATASDDKLIKGDVEVDETYVGGRARNMHRSKAKDVPPGPTGNKTAVIGIRARDTGEVRAQVVKSVDTRTAGDWIERTVAWSNTVYTDDSSVYKELRGRGYNHAAVVHSAGEYVRGQAHTQGIESFWSMLKRGIMGVFHHVSVKHLQRYVDEFATRATFRDFDTEAIMEIIFWGGIGRRLTYEELIR